MTVVMGQQENFSAEQLPVIGIIAAQDEPEAIALDPLRGEMRDFCRRIVTNEKFSAKAGTTLVIPIADKNVHIVVIAGIGNDSKAQPDDIRQAAFRIARAAADRGLTSLSLSLPGAAEPERSRAAAEGAVLAGAEFSKYVKRDEADKFAAPEKLVVFDGCCKALEEGRIMAEAQLYARSIANEPANIITPESLAEKAKALAAEMGLECELWDEERIQKENMGAYYAVARGSANKPRFIKLTYNPEGEAKGHTVLVGKGLTFDSGGLDITPADYLVTMKGDKTGACVVLGAIKAAAGMKLPQKVTVLIAAAENMPGSAAYRPDDILRARNGKTIEVNNTDAEGRLTLADALAYASELKPDRIIDIATLKGACAVALGSSTAGLFTNNDALGDALLASSSKTGERFWKLPMDDPNLRKQVKSDFADLVNSAGRYGGAITAAMFLEEFVDENIPWAHLDIAASDFIKAPYSYYVKGMTAYGTRTLAEFLRELN